MTNTCFMHGDRWQGRHNREWRVESPSEQDLAQALQKLDASTHSLISVHGDGECHVSIGGGDGRYVVYFTEDNSEFWNLIGGQTAAGQVLLNAGGQEGDYPAIQIVSLEQAYEAAQWFLLHRQRSPQLRAAPFSFLALRAHIVYR